MNVQIIHSAFTGWRRYTLVEPPLVLFLFTQAITSSVITDLIVFQSCRIMLGARNKDCNVLHTNSSSEEALNLEKLIQPHASYILMVISLIEGLVPAFLSFFLGSWSDRYGRKPLLIIGYLGLAINSMVWCILCTMDIDPWMFLIASVPSALTGGYCTIFVATLCYITDIRNDRDRAWHMTLLNMLLAAGLFFGAFAGRAMYANFSYIAVLGTAAVGSAIATLYVLFYVPESVQCNAQRSWRSLFDLSLIKDMIVTCTKKRDGFNRAIVWCCICCLGIHMILNVDNSVGFLFTSAKLGWNVEDFSLHSAATVLLMIIGTLVGAKLSRSFINPNMADMLIAVLANTSSFAGSMAKALTTKSWHFYLASGLAMFSGLSLPVIRTTLSNTVESKDVGKVFSLATSTEAIMDFASAPLFTMVYTFNMSLYPAPVYLLSAGFSALIIITLIIIDMLIFKSNNANDTS